MSAATEAISQRVMDRLSARRDGGASVTLERAVLSRARAWLIRKGDPVVTVLLDGRPLLVPLSHDLSLHRRDHPGYSANLGRIAAAVGGRSPLVMIDIGANVGDSAFIVSHVTAGQILCVEGDPSYLPLLRHNVTGLRDVEIEPAFVGASTGSVSATIARRRGTGRLVTGGDTTVDTSSLDDIIVRHPRFAAPTLLKSDTDGFEARILCGNLDAIERLKPVLFFEYDPDLLAAAGSSGLEIFDALRQAGYGPLVLFDNIGNYLLSTSLRDAGVLEDLHAHFTGWGGRRYMDVAAFPQSEEELFGRVRTTEARLAAETAK